MIVLVLGDWSKPSDNFNGIKGWGAIVEDMPQMRAFQSSCSLCVWRNIYFEVQRIMKRSYEVLIAM